MRIFGWTITITRGTPALGQVADRAQRNEVAMRRNGVVDLKFGTAYLPHLHRDELSLIERVLRSAQLAQRSTRAASRPGTPTICANVRLSELHGRFGAQAVIEPAPPTVALAVEEVWLLSSAVEDLAFLPDSEVLIAEGRQLLADLHTRWGHARAQRDHAATAAGEVRSTAKVALRA